MTLSKQDLKVVFLNVISNLYQLKLLRNVLSTSLEKAMLQYAVLLWMYVEIVYDEEQKFFEAKNYMT